jgi:hypothetical protein
MTWILIGAVFYAVTSAFAIYLVNTAPLRDDLDD